jgi:uncharacterized protein (TIGR02284 family)
MTDREAIQNELRDVLTRIVDSAEGYEHSAKEAGDGRFAVMFRERATERRGFATELRSHLETRGQSIDDDGSLLAGAHRAFVSIRDAVTGSDDESVVREIERGETKLLEEYDEGLRNIPASDPAHALLERQRKSVEGSLAGFKSQVG